MRVDGWIYDHTHTCTSHAHTHVWRTIHNTRRADANKTYRSNLLNTAVGHHGSFKSMLDGHYYIHIEDVSGILCLFIINWLEYFTHTNNRMNQMGLYAYKCHWLTEELYSVVYMHSTLHQWWWHVPVSLVDLQNVHWDLLNNVLEFKGKLQRTIMPYYNFYSPYYDNYGIHREWNWMHNW